jgi:hypothetical protein
MPGDFGTRYRRGLLLVVRGAGMCLLPLEDERVGKIAQRIDHRQVLPSRERVRTLLDDLPNADNRGAVAVAQDRLRPNR